MRSSVNTGIQRVVRSIIAEARRGEAGLFRSTLTVEYSGGRFFILESDGTARIEQPYTPANEWPILYKAVRTFDILASRIGLVRPWERLRQGLKSRFYSLQAVSDVHLDPLVSNPSEKTLLLLDSTWDASIWSSLDAFRSAGGSVFAVLYDLIPFTHPETVAEGTCIAHTKWWSEAPRHLDGVMCISKSVRNEYIEWLEANDKIRFMPADKVGFFHLGSEFDGRDPIINIISKRLNFYLMVGSLEPRKNHARVLEAFESIWASGDTACLVIAGAYGWKSDDLVRRITSHPEYQKRLFLIRDASDRDLSALYRLSDAVICASLAEGYGLPIVEALRHGKELLCSDIEVFHEISESGSIYFDPLSVETMTAALEKHRRDQSSGFVLKSAEPICTLNWAESYSQLQQGIVRCLAR